MIIPEEIRKNVLFMKDKNGSLNIRSYKKNVSKETFNFLQEHNITIFDEFVLHCNLNYFDEHDYKYNINESSIEKPNYFYWNFIDYIIDTNEIKFKIKYDESKTEYENMISNGYYRIYDAGNLKLIYKK